MVVREVSRCPCLGMLGMVERPSDRQMAVGVFRRRCIKMVAVCIILR